MLLQDRYSKGLDAYVADLANVIDVGAIRAAKIRMGVDPLGGAGVHYWGAVAARYGLDLTVVSDVVDPDVFRLALEMAQVNARNVAYIENTPMFVQVASALGIRSILHLDYRSTYAELGSWGLSLSPSSRKPLS